MNTTTNYGLKQYEGSDEFNPLDVDVYNMGAIDTAMHDNALNSIPEATHVLAGTVHTIVRSNPDARFFSFVATSDFTFGDTFTVDGIAYTGKTTSGEVLQTDAFVEDATVICSLDGSDFTLNVNNSGVAPDSERLGGELPSHYATQSDMTQAQNDIADNAGDIADINTALTGIITGTLSAGATTVTLIDARIKTTSIIEPYQYIPTGVDTEIIAPTKIAVSSGQCTLTFEAQPNAVTVGVRVIG